MKKHVVSLELAKQLKEAGIEIETEFYHFKGKILRESEMRGMTMHEDNKPVAAPLLTELLEITPVKITNKGIKYYFTMMLGIECNLVGYRSGSNDDLLGFIELDTAPNSLAKLLIYLYETGLWMFSKK